MSNNPLVSVIIPCYNCEKYVKAAIQSIIKQTYTNLEILITDDCSSDNTYSILIELAKKDSRIILHQNDKNYKLVKSLNDMIVKARGKYIARMDADDISLPRRIEKQVEWLEGHPDYVICGTGAWYITRNGKKIWKSSLPITDEEINIAKYYKNPFIHPSVMIQKRVLDIFKYKEEYFFVEDYELWFRILCGHKGHNIKKPLLLYRYYHDSITKKEEYKQTANKLLVDVFSENLTNKNTPLADKWIGGFLSGEKIIDVSEFDVLLYTLFNKVYNCQGYNFNILLWYLKYFFDNNKLNVFMNHLSTKQNFIFFLKLIIYIIRKASFFVISKFERL